MSSTTTPDLTTTNAPINFTPISPTPDPITSVPTPTTTFPITAPPTTAHYTYRPRSTLKAPLAFPVSSSPPRTRTTKRVFRGYKNTATVKMPTKTKHDGVSKPSFSVTKLMSEQKARMRADRAEARDRVREMRMGEGGEGKGEGEEEREGEEVKGEGYGEGEGDCGMEGVEM